MADGMQDLMQATQMANNATNDLGATLHQNMMQLAQQRAILGANQQVEQIKNSELDDAKKFQGIRDVASSLTQNLMTTGMPLDRIQALGSSITQPQQQVQNTQEAMMSQDPALQDRGKSVAEYEQANKERLMRIANQNKLDVANTKNTNLISKDDQKNLSKLYQSANGAVQSSRKPLGVTEQQLNKINEAEMLNKDNPNPNIIGLKENAMVMASILSGGVPSEGEIDSLMPPNTRGITAAKFLEIATNSPHPTDVPGFMEYYNSMLDRSRQVLQANRTAMVKQTFRGENQLAQRTGDNFSAKYEALVPGDSAKFNPDTNRVEFASDAKIKPVLDLAHAILTSNQSEQDIKADLEQLQQRPDYAAAMRENPAIQGRIRMFQRKGKKSQ